MHTVGICITGILRVHCPHSPVPFPLTRAVCIGRKRAGVHPTTFVSQSTTEACSGSPPFLWNKRGRRPCTGGWFSVHLGDTFCVCFLLVLVGGFPEKAVECSALTPWRDAAPDGDALAGRPVLVGVQRTPLLVDGAGGGSAAAPVVRPPSFRCCPSPPLLGADCTWPVRSASCLLRCVPGMRVSWLYSWRSAWWNHSGDKPHP